MKNVYLKYNPYTLKSELLINEKPVSEKSKVYEFLDGYRLQQWMDPMKSAGWEGLLTWLQSECNSDEITLTFHGTTLDYADLEELTVRDGKPGIRLVHENADSARDIEPDSKLSAIKELYEEIKNGPVADFHTEKIDETFSKAVNSDFEIIVIAPMSSGKSTIINAILGHDLLPAINQATTAVITRIRDVDGQKDFTVSAVDQRDNIICQNEIATLQRITELNGTIDPTDQEKKRALVKEIRLEGDIAALSSHSLHTVFVDTPGGNNAGNRVHQKVMETAINNEDKSLVLYVFNGTQVSTEDNAAILETIAAAMKKSTHGKQSRDRFLFVANRMDDVDVEKESYESMVETIRKSLEEVGIINPNLYLVSAKTAKLIRMVRNGEPLSESEEDDYDSLTKKLTRKSRRLYEYSALNQQQKQQMKAQTEMIFEKYPTQKGIPEVAEINSGIPALEMAIREYLEKYALAIKLQQAQEAFMNEVREKDIIGKAEQRWNESEAAYQEARAAVEQAKEKLKKDTSLQQAIDQIDQISFDEKPCMAIRQRFIADLQNLGTQYRGKTQISLDEANQYKRELEAAVAEKSEKCVREVHDALKEHVEKVCNEALSEYRRQLSTLAENGLLEIGGIKIDKLADFRALAFHASVAQYKSVVDASYWTDDTNFFGGIKRFFGIVFKNDTLGRHRVEATKDVYNFEDYVPTCSMEAIGEVSSNIDRQLSTAKKQVETMKIEAKNQSVELRSIVERLTDEIDQKTQSRESLSAEWKKNEEMYAFADEIIQKANAILTI